MHGLKTFLMVLLILLVTVFTIQNMAIIEIEFLVWSVSTPRALLVIILLLVGFLLGYLATTIGKLRHRKPKI